MTSNKTNQKNLIVKYLCGETSSQEVETIESMLQSDPEFKQLFKETRFVWEQSAKPLFNNEQDWHAIRHRIGFGQERHSTYSFFMRIAVVIAVVLSVSAGLWTYWNVPGYGRWVVFETGTSSDSIVLPDASIVFLNRNSSLKFLNAFTGDERKVALQGEGYFEIYPDSNRPFRVEAGYVSVMVTGTAFHLDNSRADNLVELNVTNGSVTMYSQDQQISVYRGERALASADFINKAAVSDRNFISWKTGLLEFNNASLKEISVALKDHFPTIDKIKINNDSDIRVTTRFRNQTLSEITDELSLHFQKKFVLNDGILIISD